MPNIDSENTLMNRRDLIQDQVFRFAKQRKRSFIPTSSRGSEVSFDIILYDMKGRVTRFVIYRKEKSRQCFF